MGIEKGDRVAAMMTNCPDFIELFLACSRLGLVFVPVNFRLTKSELDYTLKNSDPRLFVFSENYIDSIQALNFEDNLSSVLQAVLRENLSSSDSDADDKFIDYHKAISDFEGKRLILSSPDAAANPEDSHVIMYTSGTTGRPKGAVLPHRKTFFNCLNADLFFQLNSNDIMLIVTPLFHSGALIIQTAPALYKGATLVLHPKFNPKRVFEDIARYRVTKFQGVPTIFRGLLQVPSEERADLSSLNMCVIGGEKTTVELLKACSRAGFPLRQILGQTETSIFLWALENDYLKKPGTVGKPVFHAEIDHIDQEGNSVPEGSIGEIVVKGPITMKEYWRDPVKTEKSHQKRLAPYG